MEYIFSVIAVVASIASYIGLSSITKSKEKADAIKRRNASSDYKPPKIDDVPAYTERLRKAFLAGKTIPLAWRIQQLKQLRNMIVYNKEEIMQAVMKDLGKALTFEVVSSEINLIVREIDLTLKHLKQWTKPEKVYTPLSMQPARSYVYKEPLGVVLIISPWNYPVNLALVPLMAAISAGNCAFLKVSRWSENVGATLSRLIPKYLDMECIAIENEGGASMITALIQQQWDHIFFTGSVSVGKVVYEAAAKHLTPVTLELGGKNPCIVDDTIDLKFAARRIAFGKFYNCGQTCIGVDHVIIKRNVKDKFIAELKKAIVEFYGEDAKQSPSYPRIISTQATKRLAALFKDGDVVFGGSADIEGKYIAPTIIDNVKMDSTLMKDEIFGPILPIIPVDSIEEAVQFINTKPLPLALYLFSNNKKTSEFVRTRTRSGSYCVNECILHFTNDLLPFGGVGASGIGRYHGKYSFETFVHRRASVQASSIVDVPFRYPPYTSFKIALIDFATKLGW